jgi:DNA-binding MarR family transcriptional regulator
MAEWPEKIVSLIFSANRLMRERGKHDCDPFRIARMETIRFVALHKGSSMNELARYLGIVPSSATSLVDNLMKAGLLTRAPDPDDKRKRILVATRRGTEFLKKNDAEIAKHITKMTDSLDEEEKKHLVEILEKIMHRI